MLVGTLAPLVFAAWGAAAVYRCIGIYRYIQVYIGVYMYIYRYI